MSDAGTTTLARANAVDAVVHETIIESRPPWMLVDWQAIVEYRDLLLLLVVRDLRGRYKQTVLGPLWAVIGPIVSMCLFTLIFGGIARMPSEDRPYYLWSFAAVVPWTLFASCINGAAGSLVGNAHLIKKVYFPRLYMPLSSAAVAGVDFLISFVLLEIVLIAGGYYPNMRMFWLLPLVLLTIATALGMGLCVAALMMLFRDIGRLLGYMVSAWMYLTPVVYPRSQIGARFQPFFDLNPMTTVVEGFRWVLLDTPTQPRMEALMGGGLTVFLLFTGLLIFNRMERSFADVA